jgi:hypothetical protein
MKATLTFTLPEDQDEFNYASKGSAAFFVLAELGNELFRPARKHGYDDVQINELIDKIGDDAMTLIGLLEERFVNIVSNSNVLL